MASRSFLRVVGLAALAGCQPSAGPRSAAGDWVPFTSPTAGFSASYPSPPTEKVAADGRTHLYTLTYENGSRSLVVSYDPAADAGVPLADRFASIRDTLHVGAMKTAEVEVDGRRGLESSYERVKEDGTYTHRHRLFYSGGALYQVQGVTFKGSGGEAEVERFLAGFHLLPDAAAK